jgi:predicted DNA-binding transcriptional regulator AlpA
MLATYLSERALEELEELGVRNLAWIEIEVEESAGQSAVYRRSLAE